MEVTNIIGKFLISSPYMPKRKLWDPEAMKKAVEAVRAKEMGYKKAVKLFNVPRATLKDYVKKADKSIEDIVSGKMGRATHFHKPKNKQAKNG
ncbi:hypothetical protein SFRURICE_003913 [Spodoptera frugiperda]|uniref:SFRICE_010874 n=1 Tax=Spodoptera frugiperda TaxID=7108 RepID=A0A2H1WKS2_SPOFR|nr:hypothetical protein SFRURICE_003913 [Spodoptera frugiperda]